tara:strand:+ start:56 stop:268 length:213 start_codon:yes stop_codon:yes gene_type:complete
MKVNIDDKPIRISNKFINDKVGQLFEESYYMWKSEWYTKDEKESHFAKKIMAVEQIVHMALNQYLKENEK